MSLSSCPRHRVPAIDRTSHAHLINVSPPQTSGTQMRFSSSESFQTRPELLMIWEIVFLSLVTLYIPLTGSRTLRSEQWDVRRRVCGDDYSPLTLMDAVSYKDDGSCNNSGAACFLSSTCVDKTVANGL